MTTKMPLNITVAITQEDIDAGTQVDCEKCPIALALARRVKELGIGTYKSFINVGAFDAFIYSEYPKPFTPWVASKYVLSDAGVDFISNFDGSLPVQPMSVSMRYKDTHGPGLEK